MRRRRQLRSRTALSHRAVRSLRRRAVCGAIRTRLARSVTVHYCRESRSLFDLSAAAEISVADRDVALVLVPNLFVMATQTPQPHIKRACGSPPYLLPDSRLPPHRSQPFKLSILNQATKSRNPHLRHSQPFDLRPGRPLLAAWYPLFSHPTRTRHAATTTRATAPHRIITRLLHTLRPSTPLAHF